MTSQQTIAYLSSKPLKRLRSMQHLVQLQIPMAYNQRNDKALKELQRRDLEISAAIDRKVFGGG